MGNNSVGQQHTCGGVPDPLALWRSSVWTSPSGPLYAWSQRKEGGSSRPELISSLNSHLKWMRWIGSLGVSVSLCNGNVQGMLAETQLCTQRTWIDHAGSEEHSESPRKPVSQPVSQHLSQHGLASIPLSAGSIASQMDGSWKPVREDVHHEEWCLVVWNTAVGNILFGYVWQWGQRAVFGFGSFWVNTYSPMISTGVNPYPGIQVDTNFYKLIQSGFKMDQPYYATKDV